MHTPSNEGRSSLSAKDRESIREQSRLEELDRKTEQERQDLKHQEKSKAINDQLRGQNATMESSILAGEQRVMKREQTAFIMRECQLAITNLQAMQVLIINKNLEIQKRMLVNNESLKARSERKLSKRDARNNIRGTKKRDLIIQQQERAANAAARVRDAIAEKRAAFDELMSHLRVIHEKQTANMIASQDRHVQTEKLLMEMKIRSLQEDQKVAYAKNLQLRQNHKSHLDKRALENLRDVQLLESQHAKEKFEMEMVAFEELESKKIKNEIILETTRLKHMSELHTEKENVLVKKEKLKEEQLKQEHKRDLKRLMNEHRNAMRALKTEFDRKIQAQNLNADKGGTKASSRSTSQSGSVVGSAHNSLPQSLIGSRTGSQDDLSVQKNTNLSQLQSGLGQLCQDLGLEEDEDDMDDNNTSQLPKSIAQLLYRQRRELTTLTNDLRKELNDCRIAFDAKSEELLENQCKAMTDLVTEQDRLLNELRAVQEKELLYEETMTSNETKMLTERRLLNNVLETVSDGIVCINPQGIVIRYNRAAEMIFGYPASEVLNQNVSMLIPEQHASKHNDYLRNYMVTGIKKVIGIGQKLHGRGKDGTIVPIHLSISEVKEHGEHMFTGIVHDLTDEVRMHEIQRAKDVAKQIELQKFVELLDQENTRCSSLLSQILPASVSAQLLEGKAVKPEVYESASLLYFDIVGYTSLSAKVKATEIVTLLNQLYSGIDSVLAKYEVYKIETVGDCFLISSGVPNRNNYHAFELARCAVHLLKTVNAFTYAPQPEIKINIRVGIHTGMVVGGVVGEKMPKFCLFGETVQIASKMESSGAPNRIQISPDTQAFLAENQAFKTELRGEIEVKSKKMRTFWLNEIANFDPEIG